MQKNEIMNQIPIPLPPIISLTSTHKFKKLKKFPQNSRTLLKCFLKVSQEEALTFSNSKRQSKISTFSNHKPSKPTNNPLSLSLSRKCKVKNPNMSSWARLQTQSFLLQYHFQTSIGRKPFILKLLMMNWNMGGSDFWILMMIYCYSY